MGHLILRQRQRHWQPPPAQVSSSRNQQPSSTRARHVLQEVMSLPRRRPSSLLLCSPLLVPLTGRSCGLHWAEACRQQVGLRETVHLCADVLAKSAVRVAWFASIISVLHCSVMDTCHLTHRLFPVYWCRSCSGRQRCGWSFACKPHALSRAGAGAGPSWAAWEGASHHQRPLWLSHAGCYVQPGTGSPTGMAVRDLPCIVS